MIVFVQFHAFIQRSSYSVFAGDPPQVYAWFGQCVVYIIVMFVEKFLMSLLVLFDFWKKVSSNSPYVIALY